MTSNWQRILLLAPHIDDAEMGCGGTIAKLAEGTVEIHYASFSNCEISIPEGLPSDILRTEQTEAMKILGLSPDKRVAHDFPVRRFSEHRQDILELLVGLKREFEPDLVMLPSSNDIHQDHEVIHDEGLRAFKHCSLLGYELPWNNFSFSPGYFVALTDEHLTKKIKAIQAYSSQSRRKYSDQDFMMGLARQRGVQIGSHLAEAFEAIRIIG